MKTLNITVAGKVAHYFRRDGTIICGNSDYRILFTFDSEWDGHDTKTARFIWNGGYKDVEFYGSECDVPIINNTTEVRVGVYVKGDDILETTTPAVIPCKKSILCEDATSITEVQTYREAAAISAEAAAKAAERAEAAARIAQEALSTNSGGISNEAKNLLIAVLKSAVYTSDQTTNINALEIALSQTNNDDNNDEPLVEGITKNGTALSITSGVNVSQSGSTLTITSAV